VAREPCAFFTSPRWQEPFGIVGLEALTMGVPVVTWASGGVADWHPGPQAAGEDVPALARALRDAVGRRAPTATGFDRPSLMQRLVGLYEHVAAPAPIPIARP